MKTIIYIMDEFIIPILCTLLFGGLIYGGLKFLEKLLKIWRA